MSTYVENVNVSKKIILQPYTNVSQGNGDVWIDSNGFNVKINGLVYSVTTEFINGITSKGSLVTSNGFSNILLQLSGSDGFSLMKNSSTSSGLEWKSVFNTDKIVITTNSTTQPDSICLGESNNIVSGTKNIIIGGINLMDGLNGIAIGYNNWNVTDNTICIGHGCVAYGHWCCSIGLQTNIQGFQSNGIGANNGGYGLPINIYGNNNGIYGNMAIAFGTYNTGSTLDTVILMGHANTTSSSSNTILIGNNNTVNVGTTNNNILIGNTNTGALTNNIVMGNNNNSGLGGSNIVIGKNHVLNSYCDRNIILGSGIASAGIMSNTIVLSTSPLTVNVSNAFFVNPIRLGASATSNVVVYDTSTKEVTYDTYANVKTFVIDHPIDEKKYLVHACIEAPEALVMYRGVGFITNVGFCKITLPSYCIAWSNFTTHLTAINSKNPNIYSTEVMDNTFLVYGDVGKFSYIVHATRNDIEVEPNKVDYKYNSNGPYAYLTK